MDVDTKFPLLKTLGGWGIVSGPGLFMIRSLLAGLSHATVVGVSGAILGSLLWGTASVPFILSSSIGFFLGSWRWYQTGILDAVTQLERYPALLRHHMQLNFPWRADMRGRPVDWFTPTRFRSSWVLESMLVVSWISAEPALSEVRSRQEARIAEIYAEEEH